MNPQKKKRPEEAEWALLVELVGGPLCGVRVLWIPGVREREIPYYGGEVLYRMEAGKGIYLRG